MHVSLLGTLEHSVNTGENIKRTQGRREYPAQLHLLRLFWAFIRITSMVGATALSLEGIVSVDADVVRLRRGDLNALSELITRYQNRLYRYLLRIVRQPARGDD